MLALRTHLCIPATTGNISDTSYSKRSDSYDGIKALTPGPPWRGSQCRPWREHAEVARQGRPRWRHQGRQATHALDPLQHDRRRAVSPSPLQLDAVASVCQALQALLRQRRARHGSRQALATRNDSDFDAYSKYRHGAFAPWIRSVFLKLYPYEMNAEGRGDSCEYSDPEIWTFPTWYFTPEGIHLGPSFPRAIRSCEGPDWSVLPYRIVKQHPGKIRLTLP